LTTNETLNCWTLFPIIIVGYKLQFQFDMHCFR